MIMRLSLTVLALFFTVSLTAQIGKGTSAKQENENTGKVVIGQCISLGNVMAELQRFNTVKDSENRTLHILLYRNSEYSYITDFKALNFYASSDDIDYLFNELTLALKNQEERSITLGDDKLTYQPFMKKNLAFWAQKEGGIHYLTPQDLHALFGKKFDKKTWKAFLKL